MGKESGVSGKLSWLGWTRAWKGAPGFGRVFAQVRGMGSAHVPRDFPNDDRKEERLELSLLGASGRSPALGPDTMLRRRPLDVGDEQALKTVGHKGSGGFGPQLGVLVALVAAGTALALGTALGAGLLARFALGTLAPAGAKELEVVVAVVTADHVELAFNERACR